MPRRFYLTLLFFLLSGPLQAASRPGCDDDPLPEGQEQARVAYAIRCHYLPGKAWTYYGTLFDPVQAKLIPAKPLKRYPIFAKRQGQTWTIWRPEEEETDFPGSCKKPETVEWAGSCIKD